jgi:hypothetical protein
LYELLSELGARQLLRTEIEAVVGRYSGVDPVALRLAVGDRMPPTPLRVLPGGRR